MQLTADSGVSQPSWRDQSGQTSAILSDSRYRLFGVPGGLMTSDADSSQRALMDRDALAREFTRADLSPVFRSNGTKLPDGAAYAAHAAAGFADWRITVSGLVARPLSLSMADIRAMPQRTQITRHDCVEGWSAIGEWTGPQLRRILAAAGVMLALLGALAYLLHRDTVRRDSERAALAELNATLEQRVHQRTEELEHSNRELLSFSYSVSHDLRAPLRAINGFSHALAEDYGDRLDETGQSYLTRLRRAGLRMGELIDELQKLASVSRHTLRIENTDVSAIAREILDELAATSAGRVVQSHVEPDLTADADPVLIRNALQNLLANAWKFTRDSQPALIQVGGRPHGDEKLFYVTDNGIGFEMAHAAKLFQPFQQLHRREGFLCRADIDPLARRRRHQVLLCRMLKKSSSFVLASFRGSTYDSQYDSPLHSLGPCRTAF